MSLMKMPMFTWTSLMSMILVITIFPILAMTIALLRWTVFLECIFLHWMAGAIK